MTKKNTSLFLATALIGLNFLAQPAFSTETAPKQQAPKAVEECAMPMAKEYQDAYINFRSENIQLTNPTVRPGKAGQNSAAFVKITNTDKKAQKIVKATSPIAKTVELHQSTEENGVHQMRPVESIEIPGGGMMELKSGGFHIMLIDLVADLRKWQQVPITLELDNGNQLEVTYTVKKCSACSCADKNKKGKGKRKSKAEKTEVAATPATTAVAPAPETTTSMATAQPKTAA